MKRQAVFTLIKDIFFAVAAWGIVAGLFIGLGMPADLAMFGGLFGTGIPFGWRWSSKIITAVSLDGILIKLILSYLLGIPAICVVIIGDIIRCFTTRTGNQ